MQLSEIREKFVQFSGRQDLINTDDSDNGANFFINAGQRFLDRRIDFKKSDGKYFKKLAIGGWKIDLVKCRSIDKVWINDSEERWELERKDLTWLHKEFADLISETDSGSPLYWAPAMLRGINIADAESLGAFFNYTVSEVGSEDHSGVVILGPPDESMVVEIQGKFYSPKLEFDEQESYWTKVVPETLIQAALFRLETFYRNTEGAKDYLAGIEIDLIDIDKDSVHEDNINVDQLEG